MEIFRFCSRTVCLPVHLKGEMGATGSHRQANFHDGKFEKSPGGYTINCLPECFRTSFTVNYCRRREIINNDFLYFVRFFNMIDRYFRCGREIKLINLGWQTILLRSAQFPITTPIHTLCALNDNNQ